MLNILTLQQKTIIYHVLIFFLKYTINKSSLFHAIIAISHMILLLLFSRLLIYYRILLIILHFIRSFGINNWILLSSYLGVAIERVNYRVNESSNIYFRLFVLSIWPSWLTISCSRQKIHIYLFKTVHTNLNEMIHNVWRSLDLLVPLCYHFLKFFLFFFSIIFYLYLNFFIRIIIAGFFLWRIFFRRFRGNWIGLIFRLLFSC